MSTLVHTRRMQKPNHAGSRRLFLEGLENRSVLAGDVFAWAVGGHLMIQGDGDANGVHIQTMADGTVEVSGIEAGGSPTTINGSDEPFVSSNAHFLTRVHLGDGDDVLRINSETSAETDAGNSNVGNSNGGANSSANSNVGSMIRERVRDLLTSFRSGGIGNGGNAGGGIGNVQADQQLLINMGRGNDTVDAEVGANVNVHLLGNLRGDSVSVRTTSADESGESPDLMAGVNADSSQTGLNADVDANATAAISSALNANLNAAVDAAANATLGGIGLNTDLDSNLVAALASNAALNSSSNLGTNSLLNNSDANLNGAIGGSAALNLAGDAVFDEFGLFNLASLANMNAQAAATTALSNASTFGLSTDAIDDYFASSQANANADIGVLGTLGSNDQMGNGSLNTNISSGFNSAFQARNGLVPIG
jgi:hypothetical protein